MLWIVRVALQRPYTFIVMALFILIAGTLAALNTPRTTFRTSASPVIGVAWQYAGLSPDEMAGRIITPYERTLTTTEQRHRAQRERVPAGDRHRQDLLPARRRYPHGHRPGDLDLPDRAEGSCRRAPRRR
ncbi:MAG: efflux RND transporter permease subunit [Caulobacteraceae bacterium]